MTTILILLSLLLLKESSAKVSIVGGEVVKDRSEFPFQVSIQTRGSHHCGGSIIGKSHILTAAHCCFDTNNLLLPASEFTIITGNLKLSEAGPVRKSVSQIFVHKEYNKTNTDNDIAILMVSENFTEWTKNIAPVELVTSEVDPGTLCNISGWGSVQFLQPVFDDLLYTEIPVQSITNCKSQSHYTDEDLTDNMFCAGTPGKDACQGDSGGPLICNKKLTGIISWGYGGCGTKFGIYTKVWKYKSWISSHLGNDSSRNIITNMLLIFTLIFVNVNKFI